VQLRRGKQINAVFFTTKSTENHEDTEQSDEPASDTQRSGEPASEITRKPFVFLRGLRGKMIVFGQVLSVESISNAKIKKQIVKMRRPCGQDDIKRQIQSCPFTMWDRRVNWFLL
jgi:hypothetical protein